jgi:hypothetical protein
VRCWATCETPTAHLPSTERMIYTQFIRFLLPLVLTMVVQEFSGQVLNGGIARVPRATETLAAYGLAWGLVMFLTSSLLQIRQLGLVLVDSRPAFEKVQRFVLLAGLVLAVVVASLALTPLGVWVIEELHGVVQPLSFVVREALFWFIPLPFLHGLMRFYSGLLMRIRRTDVASYATTSGIGVSILAVFLLLPAGFIQERPILLPLLVTYVGVLAELGILLWGHRRYVVHRLGDAGAELSFSYVLRFFWPLALVMVIQGVSRPLINLFVAREADGTEAIAALTVAYSLGHLPYGWLNEIRSLPSAFKGEQDSLTHVRRFAVGCGLFSFSVMVVLFWTPLKGYILGTLIGVEPGLVARCEAPLFIFAFFPLAVMARAYFHGVALLSHCTGAIAPSAPVRIGAIAVALVVLPALGIHGAARGVAALLSGFAFETLTVWWGVRKGCTFRSFVVS